MTRLVVTIDTEPDDQWAPPGPDGRLPPFTFANTRGIGRLKDFLHGLGVPATWMTSHSVARDPASAAALRQARDEGDEIAGHLHGWETPPFVARDATHRSFIGEYEPALRLAKHRSLLAAHEEAFGARPASYRAGRWGIDEIETRHLAELGYRVDSSIPPGIDFRDRGGPDFRRHLSGSPPAPYRLGGLWQIPASLTPLGWLGSGAFSAALLRATGDRSRKRSAARVASRWLEGSGAARLIWVRPLKHPRADLVRAALSLLCRGAPVINVMFHSSEAWVGTSPLSRTAEDVERLYGDLEAICRALLATGAVRPTTLSAAVDDP